MDVRARSLKTSTDVSTLFRTKNPIGLSGLFIDQRSEAVIRRMAPLAVIDSELTLYIRNARFYAALRVFAIFTFTLCSTCFVLTRNRHTC